MRGYIAIAVIIVLAAPLGLLQCILNSTRAFSYRASQAVPFNVGVQLNVRQWSCRCQVAVTFTSKRLVPETAHEMIMVGKASVSFDPETVTLLRGALDDAWACLPAQLQATMQKTALAERILKSAAQGERDRKRLRDAALDLAA